MKTRTRATQCIICGKPVVQDKSTSVDRQTCKRIMVDGISKPSECEKEKSRRYQERYRESNKGNSKEVFVKRQSVATTSLKHLAKHKAKKYKRNCLKCGNKFTAVGLYNRLCGKCTIENSRQSYIKGGA